MGLLSWIISLSFVAQPIFADTFSIPHEKDPIWYPSDFKRLSLEDKRRWLENKIRLETDPEALNSYTLNLYSTFNDLGLIDQMIEICKKIDLTKQTLAFRLNCIDQEIDRLPIKEALPKLDEFIQLAQEQKSQRLAVSAMLSKAWIQSNDGNFPDALNMYSQALEKVPVEDKYLRADIQFELAIAYYTHGDIEYVGKAISILEEIIELANSEWKQSDSQNPDSSKWRDLLEFANFNLALVYFYYLRDYTKAVTAFEQVIENGFLEGPKNDAAYFIALSHAELGQYSAAKSYLQKVYKEKSIPIL